MSIQVEWIHHPETTPEASAELVTRLRAYADNHDVTLDVAKGLASLNVGGLIALVEFLETQRQGAHLAFMKDAGLPKKARKAAGRAVHRLESKGISCAVDDQRGGTLDIKQESLPSYMTIPNGDGLTVTLLSDVQFGRPECAFVVYNDSGLLEASLIDMPSRSRLKKIMRDIVTDPENPAQTTWVETAPELVRTRIVDAVERTRSAGEALPDGFSTIGALLEGPVLEEKHPMLIANTPIDMDLVKRSAELLADVRSDAHDVVPGPLFTETWFEELESTLEAAGEAQEADTEDVRRERISAALTETVAAYFTPEIRFTNAVRLLDSAYLLEALDRSDASALAHATALALQDKEIDAIDIPWCQQSITRLIDIDAFLHHLDQKTEQSHDHTTDEHEESDNDNQPE